MQSGPPDLSWAAVLSAVGGMCCCGLLVVIGVYARVCWLFSSALKRVPQQHRLMSPGQAWLFLIPFFSLVWLFFITSRIPRSIRAALDAQGRSEGGDCGRRVGLAGAICYVLPAGVLTVNCARVAAVAFAGGAIRLPEDLWAGGSLESAANLLGSCGVVLLTIFTVTIVKRSKLLTK